MIISLCCNNILLLPLSFSSDSLERSIYHFICFDMVDDFWTYPLLGDMVQYVDMQWWIHIGKQVQSDPNNYGSMHVCLVWPHVRCPTTYAMSDHICHVQSHVLCPIMCIAFDHEWHARSYEEHVNIYAIFDYIYHVWLYVPCLTTCTIQSGLGRPSFRSVPQLI